MGCSTSRLENCESLRLCKERKRFIKEAIDSRYVFTAAHLNYVQSLKTLGIALRRYAEAELLIESSLSTEVDKTPSHSSYPSPSPSHNAELGESPLPNDTPYSPHLSTSVNYMKSSKFDSVTVKLEPSFSGFGEDESFDFHPPPHPDLGPSWDFFDPSDETKGLMFVGENGLRETQGVGEGEGSVDCNDDSASRNRTRDMVNANGAEKFEDAQQSPVGDRKLCTPESIKSSSAEALASGAVLGQSSMKLESAGREDPSEFITHRAKDFLSSIKDIEHRFFRASESGKEVSRMLEANKIKLRSTEAKGRSTTALILEALHPACCRGDTVIPDDPPQPVTKMIAWHRSVSSQSSSSRNPLAPASKDDNDDSGSDFAEEFCMITGSHSSTLDRLYAWELKLYDEVKASEFIRKSYDYWCVQLRHQFAKDASTQVIDKTRAIVKDLHSQMRVALHSVDSIAKRIERLRDEELQPQLVELIQGLIRMWKVMLECHHAQYITISLAYHTKNSKMATTQKDSQGQVSIQLQHEIESFESNFKYWIDAHRTYVDALNGWLQICIVLPQERSRARRAFSPRRALAPPIFVLCRDWSAGIKTLPSGELIDAIRCFISFLHTSLAAQVEEQKLKAPTDPVDNEDSQNKEDDQSDSLTNLSSIHTSLTKVLDRLTKFSEALRKLYEDVRQGTEAAQVAYANFKTARH